MPNNKKIKINQQVTWANSSEKYVACTLEMCWEDCADWGDGHIHFADKSAEDGKESVNTPEPPQSLNQGEAKQLHVAPKRQKHVYSVASTVAN